MGSCASVHRKPSGSSALKTLSFDPKTVALEEIIESPKKEDTVTNAPAPEQQPENVVSPMKYRASFASTNKSFGSKDETFYDSQPWLESDCEDDDFHSVGGDFTPSCGNTPKRSFTGRTLRAANHLYEHKVPDSTPRRKKLFELFKDSIREELEDTDEQEEFSSKCSVTISKFEQNVASATVHNDILCQKAKRVDSEWHCLPQLVSCGSFLEKKRGLRTTAMAVEE